jgi:hypothetical protein
MKELLEPIAQTLQAGRPLMLVSVIPAAGQRPARPGPPCSFSATGPLPEHRRRRRRVRGAGARRPPSFFKGVGCRAL